MSRAAVMIDNGFFAKMLRHCFDKPRIDYELLSDILCGERERLRTYVYECMPYQDELPTDEQQHRYSAHNRFIHSLSRLNRFEIRLGKLSYDPSTETYSQKRVDVLFSVDLVRMSWDRQIDTAILIAGDSDFVPAVQAAKDAGVLVVLYHRTCYDDDGNPVTRAHDELLDICDECKVLEQPLIDSVKL